MSRIGIKLFRLCALASLSIVATLAHAQDPLVAARSARWPIAVDNHQLAAARGGFDLGNGLLVSFGIDRAVYVNGNLVSSSSAYVSDVGRMTPDQAGALAAATAAVRIAQDGAGLSVVPVPFGHATAATVIQNSLDNQDIRSLTTINAAVNSQAAFRSLGLQEALQTGLVGSLGH